MSGQFRTALTVLLALLIAALLAAGGVLCFGPDGGVPEGRPEAEQAPPAASQDGAGQAEESADEQVPEEVPKEANAPERAKSLEERAEELLEQMTLREKALQLFLVTPEQLTGADGPVTQCGAVTQAALREKPVGGIVYFADNLQTREQCQAMLSGAQEAASLGLFLAVDEEGGSVSRLAKNGAMDMTVFPNMEQIEDTQEARSVGETIGTEIRALGFNLDFAPVADVNSNPENSVIGARAFSSDPETAAERVAACVAGFRESGVLCTLKHFPGHGDTAADSHYGAAVSEKTLEELEACAFLPFRAGIEAGADFVMVGHIGLPNVTGDNTPASLSYEITTGLLREKLGFDGIIVTDSLQMEAITDSYSAGQAAVAALQAGADILLMPENLDQALSGVLDAVDSGTLTEQRIDESVRRILRVKLERGIVTAE